MTKYEYMWFVVSPGIDPLEQLNKLGDAGWRVKALLQGALHDDVGHARVLLEREKSGK